MSHTLFRLQRMLFGSEPNNVVVVFRQAAHSNSLSQLRRHHFITIRSISDQPEDTEHVEHNATGTVVEPHASDSWVAHGVQVVLVIDARALLSRAQSNSWAA